MNLDEIITRVPLPEPWAEGDNIPWHEPGFSARMLAEHLTQAHDRASRRTTLIDAHVAWIHNTLLAARPAAILDLGCGPGLYTTRLAQLGHTCTGIDYSPASIDYARATAQAAGLACTYQLGDLRRANLGHDFDLVMLLFGEFNVFSPADMGQLLTRAVAALRPGGLLLLEPHTFAALAPNAQSSTTWWSSPGGLFDPAPHLLLMETLWDAARAVNTRRYFVIHAADGSVTRFAQSLQAYHPDDYTAVLAAHGLTAITHLPGLAHDRLPVDPDFCAITARRAPLGSPPVA